MTTRNWVRLDNAAKLFSTVASGSDTQVFRVSCVLTQAVQPKILQQALLHTIELLPSYQYTLKRGFFWYYLEKTTLQPQVKLESSSPCSPLYYRGHKALLYEVTYFGSRINLEVYHVLADGMSAREFLTTLVSIYLELEQSPTAEVSSLAPASPDQMLEDSFRHHQPATTQLKVAPQTLSRRAAKINLSRYPNYQLKVITLQTPLDPFKKIVHHHQTTITTYIAAQLMIAIQKNLSRRARKQPIVISLPVNLRQFFSSASLRNFFTVINLTSKDQNIDLSSLIKDIDQQMSRQLEPDLLTQNVNSYLTLENNLLVRFLPYFIKNFGLQVAYRYSRQQVTAGLSNLGQVKIKPALAKKIDHFEFFSGTNDLQLGVISFGDQLNISFASPFINQDIAQDFCRQLTALDLNLTINHNHPYS